MARMTIDEAVEKGADKLILSCLPYSERLKGGIQTDTVVISWRCLGCGRIALRIQADESF